MSKVLSTVGKVAGVVAVVAGTVAAFSNPVSAAFAIATKIAVVAGAASLAAGIGAQVLAKQPPRQGSVTQTTIGTDQPSCEILGRTYSPGARVHLTGYGAELKKVPNPYLLAVDVVGVGGPYEALESVLADMQPVAFSGDAATGYFGGFLWRSYQLGQQTEASALALHYAGAPGWSAAAKLSGKPAIAYNALFDRDGKVFASGFSPMGSVWRGVKAYDPRKDSTYPGGSGAQRWASPSDKAAFDAARATWGYTTNPGLLALRNALGSWERHTAISSSTYQKVFGVGMPIDGLIVGDFVHLANVCDANGWECNGRIFEPGNRWDNLKRILAAGGAEPAWRGGLLGLKVQAPRVALDTITEDDLGEGEIVVGAMQGWEQRLNTLVPKYRSEGHKWEYVATTKPVTIASFVTEDGEEKREERQIDLVQDGTQASQLCAYELYDRRELGEIEIVCKPRLRRYGPGDLLNVDLPHAALPMQQAVVLRRSLDPVTMAVTLVLRGETMEKHAFALGLTGEAPPTPALSTTSDIDQSSIDEQLIADLGDIANSVAAIISDSQIMMLREKRELIRGWATIEAQFLALDQKYVALGSPADLYTVRTEAAAGYTDLAAFLASLVPAWDDVGQTTPVDGAALNAAWIGATQAIETLAAEITGRPGINGLPGAPGVNGQTSYVHYAYANSPSGTVDFTIGAPGTRAFVGTYSDFTEADSSDPAAYVWAQYKGPASFGLAARGTAVVAGNMAIKNGGPEAWDSDVYSTEGYRGGAVVSFSSGSVNADYFMIGLNGDPASSTSYETIDFAWHLTPSGDTIIYESGTPVATTFIGYDPTYVFQIAYDGELIRYLVNGNVYREVPVARDRMFYLDSSLAAPGTRITNISFVPAGSRGIDGAPGLNGSNGTNGTNGANGETSIVHFAYANSADGITDFTTGAPAGRFYVGVYSDFEPADSTNPASYTWSQFRGVDGTNGIPGAPGANGETTYVHIAYANSADGATDFTTGAPGSRTYIGLRTDFVLADSTTPGDYSWSLIKGADGAPGADGVSPILVSAQPEALTIQAGSSGAPVAGELPKVIGNAATQAGVAVTITSVTIVAVNGCTASVSGSAVQITAVSGMGGDVTYDVVAAGQTVRKRVSFVVTQAGTDGGRAQSISITNNLSWSSYQQQGESIGINASSTGKLSLNLTGNMRVAIDTGAMRFQSKVQYRAAGGTWVDVSGSEAISTTSETQVDPTRVIAANVNGAGPYSLTGLSTGAAYEVRALTRWYDGEVYPSTTALRLFAEQVA